MTSPAGERSPPTRWAFVWPGEEPSARALAALAEALMSLSPVVCLAPDGVWVEIGGSVGLLGGNGGERAVAEHTRTVAELLQAVHGGNPFLEKGVSPARLGRVPSWGLRPLRSRWSLPPGSQPGVTLTGNTEKTCEKSLEEGFGEEPFSRKVPPRERTASGVRVVVADWPITARLMARAVEAPLLVVAPGRDAKALASLPLEALGASPGAVAYLKQLGVRVAGALAALSPSAVRRRLGREGEDLVRLARAEPAPTPERFTPPEQPTACRELEPPLPPGESLLFVVKGLLDELSIRLAGRGLAVSELRVTLSYEGGIERVEELLLPRPLTTAPPLLAVLRERLVNPMIPPDVARRDEEDVTLPPPRLTCAEVAVVRTARAPRAQLSLLHRQEIVAEQIAELLARLAATLGRERVFAGELVPSHVPEESWRRAELTLSETDDGFVRSDSAHAHAHAHDTEGEVGAAALSPRPSLVFPEPLPLEGDLNPGHEVRWSGGAGVITHVWGPERLRGRWWAAPFDRDYFVVDLEGGGRIWVVQERRSSGLRVQGVFD